jgi:hypothetical protein
MTSLLCLPLYLQALLLLLIGLVAVGVCMAIESGEGVSVDDSGMGCDRACGRGAGGSDPRLGGE